MKSFDFMRCSRMAYWSTNMSDVQNQHQWTSMVSHVSRSAIEADLGGSVCWGAWWKSWPWCSWRAWCGRWSCGSDLREHQTGKMDVLDCSGVFWDILICCESKVWGVLRCKVCHLNLLSLSKFPLISFYCNSIGNLILDHIVDSQWPGLHKSFKSTTVCNEIIWYYLIPTDGKFINQHEWCAESTRININDLMTCPQILPWWLRVLRCLGRLMSVMFMKSVLGEMKLWKWLERAPDW